MTGRSECADPTDEGDLRPGASDIFDVDGYYRTGDLGRRGRLPLVSGRLDDMLKVNGATVYPSEVEDALRAVAEVARPL